MNHRTYREEVPLREICGDSFVIIINDTLEEEFDFRKPILDLDLYAVEAIELVQHIWRNGPYIGGHLAFLFQIEFQTRL